MKKDGEYLVVRALRQRAGQATVRSMTVRFRAVLSLGRVSISGEALAGEEVLLRQLSDTEFKFSVEVPSECLEYPKALDGGRLAAGRAVAVNAVWVHLETECSESLERSIRERDPSDETRLFAERLFGALSRIHESLVDVLRNGRGEWTVPALKRRETLSAELSDRDVRFFGTWKGEEGWIAPVLESGDSVMLTIRSRGPVSSEVWHSWLSSLSGGGRLRVAPFKRMLANAIEHLYSHDLRAAAIEVVAAWELFLHHEGPVLLAKKVGIRYDESKWAKLIAKAQLSASTDLFFALLGSDALGVVDAIELRNEVIHRGKRNLTFASCRKAVRDIVDALKKCEGLEADWGHWPPDVAYGQPEAAGKSNRSSG